jgi:hypothetical protein
LLSKVGPALTEIFASDDSEFAKLFSTYMMPPHSPSSKSPAAAAAATPTKSEAP